MIPHCESMIPMPNHSLVVLITTFQFTFCSLLKELFICEVPFPMLLLPPIFFALAFLIHPRFLLAPAPVLFDLTKKSDENLLLRVKHVC